MIRVSDKREVIEARLTSPVELQSMALTRLLASYPGFVGLVRGGMRVRHVLLTRHRLMARLIL